MGSKTANSLTRPRNGAIVALILALPALPLPWNMGGCNDRANCGLAAHDMAAIVTRAAVLAAIGAAIGGAADRVRHRYSPDGAKLHAWPSDSMGD